MPASPYASVWYAWTAAWTGSLVVTTADSAFDTVVSVYYTVGPNAILASLNPVASNDDCPGGGGTSCLTASRVGVHRHWLAHGRRAVPAHGHQWWAQHEGRPGEIIVAPHMECHIMDGCTAGRG